ncbi:hypothetical protein M8J76_009569 [Diaphorina citri]|nr:hypothetical protein M8J76_009569 [Diaphorina citri]
MEIVASLTLIVRREALGILNMDLPPSRETSHRSVIFSWLTTRCSNLPLGTSGPEESRGAPQVNVDEDYLMQEK